MKKRSRWMTGFVALLALGLLGCELDEETGEEAATDDRPAAFGRVPAPSTGGGEAPAVQTVIQLLGSVENDDLQCGEHPADDGSLAPGADIDAVYIVNTFDPDNPTYHEAVEVVFVDEDSAICPAANDHADPSAAAGVADGEWVSLNGGDLRLGFDVVLHEGDVVEIYEIDTGQGVSEVLQGISLCKSMDGLCETFEFEDLESNGKDPIVLPFD